MKNFILLFSILAVSFSVNAQITTPQPSPFSKLEQKVGLTDISIEYSRPSMKGRKIFGNLVPFGKMWRAGANKNTTISFSDDVVIDGQTIKAGAYAIFIMPNETSWDIFFYADTNNWGTPREWDKSKVAAKTTVKAHTLDMKVETWTITIDNLKNNSAEIGFIWENTFAAVPFSVPTDKLVESSINKVLNGPSAADYYAAAVYYSIEGKNLQQAEKWMDKAISMTEEPGFWQYRQQSLLYAKLGKKKEAIAAAKKSLQGAKERGNEDYIKMNMDSLKEWGAM